MAASKLDQDISLGEQLQIIGRTRLLSRRIGGTAQPLAEFAKPQLPSALVFKPSAFFKLFISNEGSEGPAKDSTLRVLRCSH